MATDTPPYLNAYGNIDKALNKIIKAQTPPRFTQDFLATTLGMPGGSAKPIIPFLKRLGFLGSDGVPTENYKQFRYEPTRGKAAATALKVGYKNLYSINEYVHDASDKELIGLVIQATGQDADSQVAKAIVASFKAVKEFADFSLTTEEDTVVEPILEQNPENNSRPEHVELTGQLGLSYTINLNLPATSDIKVFDAIFKSLKENLLK